MSPEEKKAFILLKSVIFHYHGLDEEEDRILHETAAELDADEALEWASNFISQDQYSAFDRAREYLMSAIGGLEKEKRVSYLGQVWKANNVKGFITEMEATAMLQLAKDWEIESELLTMIRN